LQILHHIFPVVVYANLAATAAAPVGEQLWGLRVCILIAAAARLATRLLLIFGQSMLSMQVLEVCPPLPPTSSIVAIVILL
jgi:hypothetical protein